MLLVRSAKRFVGIYTALLSGEFYFKNDFRRCRRRFPRSATFAVCAAALSSANGGEMLEHNWKYFPRNKLAALSAIHPKQIDAGFSDMQVVNQWMQQNKHLSIGF